MKIKFLTYLLLISIILSNSEIKANQIFFDSKNVKIEENGDMIYASKGLARIPEEKILIEGDKSIYNKSKPDLTIIGNVKFFDNLNDVYIESEKAIYDEKKNTVLTNGRSYIKVENKYKIYSSDILYERNSEKISSKLSTKVLDDLGNIYYFNEGFLFNKAKETIHSKITNIIDSEKNKYTFETVKINLLTKELAGKEIKVNFIDDYFGNEKNDPLLMGRSAVSNDKKTTIHKTVFSTCNIENRKCRGWELQSEEFRHDKIEKVFEYKNSWLKMFDKKVFFFPYFNHPDPSVVRKSGFLTPVYSSSDNLGRSVNIPYFHVLSETKDMTHNPRLYSDNDFIIQSEFREVFDKSKLIADFSFNYNQDEKKTNTHTIIDLEGKFDENTSYFFEFQNTSNDNYLKIHDLQNLFETNELVSKINPSLLTSFLKLEKVLDDTSDLTTSFRMYEDTTTTITSDRYQYIFPDFTFNKYIELDEDYHGDFYFGSSGYQKNYDTNIYEAQVNNNFDFRSFNFFTNTGLLSNYDLKLINFNTYSENSSSFDEHSDHDLFATLSLNTEYPLKKKLSNSTSYIKPKIQFNFSPTNGKDISTNNVRLSYDNLFSTNRIGRGDMVEEGRSLTFGLEFEKQNLLNEKIISFNIGNVIKDKKNSSMPAQSKLDQTRSDIVGNFAYHLNENIQFDYDFSYDRDLDFSNFDAINAKLGNNKIVTSFNYITENHEFGDTETISNDTKINFTNDHSIKFNTTKDLKEDFTQFYELSYKYETDCLLASLQYKKKFFTDGNLVPDESLNFFIKFIPFTSIKGSANTVFE